LRRAVDAMASQGMRVLGVARAACAGELPAAQTGFAFELLGLVGFSDPLRPDAAAAIRECRAAGVRVAMITGDYPATARSIARQAGIDADGTVLTGPELETLSDAELRRRVRDTAVYARVVPRQKLRIVEALKAEGEVVAMTGDGVNDAPSLKAAHIGVAMGARGTDVAREAAALVLLDDDFGSLVAALKQGRRIYDNLRKAMSYILAVHVPIAGLSLLPLLFGWPLILAPVHIVFLELVIDPVCSIVFEAEAEENDLMRRPPRDPHEPLFSPQLIAWSLLQGAAALAVVTALFLAALAQGLPLDNARAITFAAMVTTNFGLIFVNRSFGTSMLTAIRRPNGALWRMLALATLLLGVALYLPSARTLFGFGLLHADDIALSLLSGAAVLAGLEMLKRALPRRG
jgi:Ca2+-transporting ATPase